MFVLLAVIHTWPLATSPGRLSLNHNADAQLNAWIVSWVAHALPRDPVHLFDANIFYPEPRTLTYSEPLLVPALLGAPVRWAGGSPVLTFNLLLLAGLTLTALAGYAVAFEWTGDRSAALLAGSAVAFNTHVLTRLPHLQAAHAYALPLALLAADRIIHRRRMRDAVWLALWMAVLASTSGYLTVFAAIAVAILLAVRPGEWLGSGFTRVAGLFGLATTLVAAASAPVMAAYGRSAAGGLTRSIEWTADYSATPAGYLAATARLHSSTWSSGFLGNPVDSFFPGLIVFILAAFGVLQEIRRSGGWDRRSGDQETPDPDNGDRKSRDHASGGQETRDEVTRDQETGNQETGSHETGDQGSGGHGAGQQEAWTNSPAASGAATRGRVRMLVALALIGFLLSLGQQTPLYGWLYGAFPPVRGLRVAARFGYLFLLAAALLAAYGLAALRRRRSRGVGLAAGAALVALVNIEALHAPIHCTVFEGIPRIYALLRDEPGRVALAEMPFFPGPAAFENGAYVLNSTAHFRPLLNGYSGYTPDSYRRAADVLWGFPADYAIEEIIRLGVTHVTVHADRFGPEAEEVFRTLDRRPEFELVGVSRGVRLYRIR
ncbi:MAG TPA: hypothetical protein VLD67_06625 [Vicinamibacterales bacterium]|nr:hypothetical protein [Vicinamibacterales bacterium]